MLPPRSKRFAGVDGQIERLRLITPWELGGAVILLLLLFALIFPRRALIEALHQQERLDDLTLAYIENLRRVTTGDDDLTVLAIRFDIERVDYATIEAKLAPIVEKNDPRLRIVAEQLLNRARLHEMRRILAEFHGEAALFGQLERLYRRIRSGNDLQLQNEALAVWIETLYRTHARRPGNDTELKSEVAALIATALEQPPDASRRLALVSLAMMTGLDAEARRLLATLDPATLRERLPQEAAKALGYGYYETAAMLYLLEREYAANRESARTAFRRAIEVLMAGNFHALALETAEHHIGELADDPATLRFLAKTALAAGDPQRAADYARRLIFVPRGQEGK